MVEHGNKGSHGRYSKGCRCTGCTLAHRKYEREAKRRRSRSSQGIDFYEERCIDVQETRDYIFFLSSKGLSLRDIGLKANTTKDRIAMIKSGRTKKITRDLADRILGVAAIKPSPYCTIDATETHKLVEELTNAGLSKAEIARQIGIPSGRLNLNKRIDMRRHEAIVKLHSQRIRKAER